MAANTSPIFIESAKMAEVTFVNADGTTAKDLISAGADGSKVTSIAVTSDDTANRQVNLYIHDGSTAYLVGSKTIPDLSGTNGNTDPAVELLDIDNMPWLDSDGEFFIPTGYKIQVAMAVAVTAAKTVTVVCFAGDY